LKKRLSSYLLQSERRATTYDVTQRETDTHTDRQTDRQPDRNTQRTVDSLKSKIKQVTSRRLFNAVATVTSKLLYNFSSAKPFKNISYTSTCTNKSYTVCILLYNTPNYVFFFYFVS